MKAITIRPKEKGSIELKDLKKPSKLHKNEVLVKVLEAGVCRTDLEIYEGLYGEAPKNESFLIMGHESIGIVENIGPSVDKYKLQPGDYVTRTVRRPCGDSLCHPCYYRQQDFCTTGNHTETGIKGLHGIMTEYFKDDQEFLVRVSKEYRHIGVLMEPLSFAEKAVHQTFLIQKRFDWHPKRALVLGAGPIGLLETMILRNRTFGGIDTYVAARSKSGNLKSKITEEVGAKYVSLQDTNLGELGKFDIIMESSGSAELLKDTFDLLNTNGVLCLTSITGGESKSTLPLEKINIDFVLGNKVMFGAVNAQKDNYETGLRDIKQFETRWPGVMSKLITRRVKLDSYKEAFEKRADDIKTIIEFY